MAMNCPTCRSDQLQQLNGLAGLGQVTTIAWDTVPHTDGATGKEVEWTCMDWVTWHKRLVTRWGRDEANRIFISWWEKIRGEVPWYVPFPYQDFCGYGSDFLNYFRSVGLTDHISFIAGIVAPIYSGATEIASGVEQVSTEVSQAAVQTTKAATGTAKTVKVLLPVVLIGSIGLIGWYAYKNYIRGKSRIKVKGQTI